MKRRVAALMAVLAITVISGAYGLRSEKGAKAATPPVSHATSIAPSPSPQPAIKTFDKSQYSLTDPTSIWVVVNKIRPLQPRTYTPQLVVPNMQLRSNITSDERQVRPDNAAALKVMADAAKADGITLTLESGYRSYNFQVNLYNHYVSVQGKAVADSQSARPGYSEHQTGLAADLGGITKPSCNVEQCFTDTPEGKWLAANAYKYGYVIRYPVDKTPVTGYEYEPWHVRFVGTELSTEMHTKSTETLEEFFNLPAAPDYN
jgi:D-alanyl-D-alanine carboxypeptidase